MQILLETSLKAIRSWSGVGRGGVSRGKEVSGEGSPEGEEVDGLTTHRTPDIPSSLSHDPISRSQAGLQPPATPLSSQARWC